jgi:hypothetical protein
LGNWAIAIGIAGLGPFLAKVSYPIDFNVALVAVFDWLVGGVVASAAAGLTYGLLTAYPFLILVDAPSAGREESGSSYEVEQFQSGRAKRLLIKTDRAQVGRGLWLWWVVAGIVGFGVGFAVFGVVGRVVRWVGAEAVIGAAVGIAQWLILRRQVSQDGWWVLASTVGLALGLSWAFDMGFPARLAVAGAPVGIAQWLVLRRQVPRAGWWVLASTVGLAVGFAVAFAVLGDVEEVVAFAVLLAVIGAVYGAITGAVLVWLLRQATVGELGPSQAAE